MSMSDDTSLHLCNYFQTLESREKQLLREGNEDASRLCGALKNCALVPALLMEDVDSVRLYDPFVSKRLKEIEAHVGKASVAETTLDRLTEYTKAYLSIGRVISYLSDRAILDNDANLAMSLQRATRTFVREDSLYIVQMKKDYEYTPPDGEVEKHIVK